MRTLARGLLVAILLVLVLFVVRSPAAQDLAGLANPAGTGPARAAAGAVRPRTDCLPVHHRADRSHAAAHRPAPPHAWLPARRRAALVARPADAAEAPDHPAFADRHRPTLD